eukprot:Gb_21096 [translate_table: standard]
MHGFAVWKCTGLPSRAHQCRSHLQTNFCLGVGCLQYIVSIAAGLPEASVMANDKITFTYVSSNPLSLEALVNASNTLNKGMLASVKESNPSVEEERTEKPVGTLGELTKIWNENIKNYKQAMGLDNTAVA